jgi:hypothetical protein
MTPVLSGNAVKTIIKCQLLLTDCLSNVSLLGGNHR